VAVTLLLLLWRQHRHRYHIHKHWWLPLLVRSLHHRRRPGLIATLAGRTGSVWFNLGRTAPPRQQTSPIGRGGQLRAPREFIGTAGDELSRTALDRVGGRPVASLCRRSASKSRRHAMRCLCFLLLRVDLHFIVRERRSERAAAGEPAQRLTRHFPLLLLPFDCVLALGAAWLQSPIVGHCSAGGVAEMRPSLGPGFVVSSLPSPSS
jgi:hypothetical protein